jgi:hypothetical protein
MACAPLSSTVRRLVVTSKGKRRLTYAVAGVVVLTVGGFFAYRQYLRSRSICQEVAAGSSLEKLTRVLSEHGMYASTSGDGTHFIIEHFKTGGIGCTVEVQGGRVISAKYDGGARRAQPVTQ